jgi:hypothetical protein
MESPTIPGRFMTNRQRLLVGFGIPPVTMLFVWCLVLAARARPSDLSHAATIYGGIGESLVAGLFNLLPFWLYNVFRASCSSIATSQVQYLRRVRAGLVVGAMLFYSINTLCHGAIWWDLFSLPRIDAQQGLGFLLVWIFSLVALYLGYGIGLLLSRVVSLFKT